MTTFQFVKTRKFTVPYQDINNGIPSGPSDLGRTVTLGVLDEGDEIISVFLNVAQGFVLPGGEDVVAAVSVDGTSIVGGSIRPTGVVNGIIDATKFYIFSFTTDKDILLEANAGSVDVAQLSAGSLDAYVNYISH